MRDVYFYSLRRHVHLQVLEWETPAGVGRARDMYFDFRPAINTCQEHLCWELVSFCSDTLLCESRTGNSLWLSKQAECAWLMDLDIKIHSYTSEGISTIWSRWMWPRSSSNSPLWGNSVSKVMCFEDRTRGLKSL